MHINIFGVKALQDPRILNFPYAIGAAEAHLYEPELTVGINGVEFSREMKPARIPPPEKIRVAWERHSSHEPRQYATFRLYVRKDLRQPRFLVFDIAESDFSFGNFQNKTICGILSEAQKRVTFAVLDHHNGELALALRQFQKPNFTLKLDPQRTHLEISVSLGNQVFGLGWSILQTHKLRREIEMLSAEFGFDWPKERRLEIMREARLGQVLHCLGIK